MTATEAGGHRLQSLDVIRGVAVMGIVLANMPAFALPMPAYFSPLAWGGHDGPQVAAWLANFIFVEGKMRGLFSFLFGASMLLVIDRADRAGESAAKVHFARMAVLFLFGLAHMCLLWWGDILAHYALVGAFAFLFARLRSEQLLAASLTALVVTIAWNCIGLSALISSAARDTPEAIALWDNFAWSFGVPPAEWTLGEVAAMRGGWLNGVHWRWDYLDGPIAFAEAVGPETLTAMLLGLWGYRSGFVTGAWARATYLKVAWIGLGIAWAAYLLIGLNTIAHGFDQRWVYADSIVAAAPFRMIGTLGYASLIILLLRQGSMATERIAAVGRAAFTNYLGTSLLMAAIFYGWGLGQFAYWDRAAIYAVVPIAWLLMLAWSKPWLARFRYGPFEWMWRSLARGRPQPMLR